jgi:phosphoribosylformimino-5-aminoimidazole carboxamide ribotide isomerase
LDIIPAIDLREGECARIFGDLTPTAIYSDDPLEQAILFQKAGVESVHITDLDGSFSGHLCNLRVIQEMVECSGLLIQLGGGVRSMEHIDTLANIGVSSIVLGAPFLRNAELTQKAFAKYGDRVVPGVDGRDGMVAIEGFETLVSKSVNALLKEIKAMGMRKVIYTDLLRYGTMKGPNFERIREMVETSGLQVVVAGGISDYNALKRLKEMGVAGAIVGKAIFSGVIELKRAMKIARA